MEPLWTSLLGAFVGSISGGLITLLLNRSEANRRHLIELYHQQLPRYHATLTAWLDEDERGLVDKAPEYVEAISRQFEDIWRTGHLSGKHKINVRLKQEKDRFWSRWREVKWVWEKGLSTPENSQLVRTRLIEPSLQDEYELHEWLARKVRRRDA